MKRNCESLPLQDYSHHMAQFDLHYAIAVQQVSNTDLASKKVAVVRLQSAQVQLSMTIAALIQDTERLGKLVAKEKKQMKGDEFVGGGSPMETADD